MMPMGGMGQKPWPMQMWGQPQMPSPGAARPMPPESLMGPTSMPPELMFGGQIAPGPRVEEQSYLENILRLNRGKTATIYTTNENNPEWPAKVFRGQVENAARDHVVLSDPQTGTRYVILMVNIDYLTFDEPLRYAPEIYRGF